MAPVVFAVSPKEPAVAEVMVPSKVMLPAPALAKLFVPSDTFCLKCIKPVAGAVPTVEMSASRERVPARTVPKEMLAAPVAVTAPERVVTPNESMRTVPLVVEIVLEIPRVEVVDSRVMAPVVVVTVPETVTDPFDDLIVMFPVPLESAAPAVTFP